MNVYIKSIFIIFGSFIFASTAAGQCFDEGHSPFQNQGWLSCNTSIGPIPERGDAHWIMYDLGEEYPLDSIKIWNHNVWSETGMGIKDILIDYSTDQSDWTTVGPIEIQKAPGSWKYTGTTGPSLQNGEARYVLITVISTWDGTASCAGFGEIRFDIGESVSTKEDNTKEWTLSPNPASDYITIQNPNYADVLGISIYNSVGQKIKDIKRPTTNQLNIPVSDLLDGIYFISLYTKNNIDTQSFIKG